MSRNLIEDVEEKVLFVLSGLRDQWIQLYECLELKTKTACSKDEMMSKMKNKGERE